MGEQLHLHGHKSSDRIVNRRIRAAAICSVSAMLGLANSQAGAASTVPSDTQYQFQNSAGNFSTGFTPTFTSDNNAELNFGGTTYTATDDLSSANLNDLTFLSTGLITIAASSSGNTLNLTNNNSNIIPSIYVGAGGATIQAVLSGGNGFTLSGGGVLTLNTNADTYSGNVTVNSSTLALNIGQSTSANYFLNSGTLSTNQTLAATNLVYVSGTSTFISSNATVDPLFYGNGNLNWSTTTTTNTVSQGGTASIFSNFGGTINWGSNNNGMRIVSSTGSTSSWNPFANFNLGSGSAVLSTRNGTEVIVLGGLQSTGTATGIAGQGSSGGHDDLYIVGSANIPTETFAGGIYTSSNAPNSFLKTGTGTLVMTGTSTAIDIAGSNGAAYQVPGTYNVYGGTLQLNFSKSASNLLPATTAFGIGQGGTLSLLGGSTGNSSQTFAGAGTTVAAGGGAIVMNANGAGNTLTLNLGALTTTSAGSALNISTTGAGTDVVTTTTAAQADGTYGPRVTYGSGFATTVSSASPYTLSTYTPGATFVGDGSDSSTTNYQLTGSGTVSNADSVNSLTVSSTTGSPQSLTLNNNLALTNGGLLYNGSDNYTVGGSGTLNSGATEQIIQQLGSGTLTISAPISGGSSGILTKAGSGTLVLAASNTYTGATNLDGGVTSISANANLGVEGNGATVNIEGGTLQATSTFGLYNGSAGNNNRNVVIGGSGGTIDVTAGNTLTIAGVVSDSAIATISTSLYGPLTKTDSGTLVLSGTNTYAGATFINGGILSVNNLANGNSASGIGQSPNTANALTINGATLQYTGGGASTDRDFTMGQSGATIDANDTGTLAFTSVLPIVTSGSGARTLTLTSSSGTGSGGSMAMQIVDGTGGSTSLAVSGTNWTLSNPNNTYTGNTTISTGGTLTLSSPLSSNPIASSPTITTGVSHGSTANFNVNGLLNNTLVLAPGQTLAGTGTVTGSVTVGNTAILAPGSSSSTIDNLAITNNLTLNNGSTSIFQFGPSSNSMVNVGGTLTLNSTDGVDLYLAGGGGSKFTTDGTYDLYTFGSLVGTPSSAFAVENPASGLNYTFGTSGDDVTLTIGGTAVASASWNVDANGNYSGASNWNPQVVPTGVGATAVFGSAITAPRTVTVDEPVTVGEIDFNNANAYTLAADANKDAITFNNGGDASVLNDLNGSHTIATPLVVTGLGAGTSALNIAVSNAGNTITLSGNISEAGNSATLTKTGDGTLALTGNNSYTGGTNISQGSVQITSGTSLGAASGAANLNSSTYAITLEALDSITSSRNLTVAGSNNNFQVDGSSTYELDGTVTDGSSAGALTKTGTGTLALTGSDTYSGGTTISAGTLALGNGTIAGPSGAANITGNIVDNAALVLDRPAGDDYTLGSTISGTGSLTQSGGDNVTLGVPNTFAGATVISAGSLILGDPNALQNSTLNYNNQGGTLSFGAQTAATLGGLTGAQNLDLDNPTPAAVALTIGNNGTSQTYSGALTGGGSLTKVGNGVETLSGANTYIGATNANAGGITLTGSLGSATTPTGAVTMNSGGILTIQGTASLYSASLTTSSGGVLVQSGGTAVVSGALDINANDSSGGSPVELTGGTMTVNSLAMLRSAAIYNSTAPTAGAVNDGLYVNGGTLNVTTTMDLGNGTIGTNTSNSSENFREDSGTITVGGLTTLTTNQGSSPQRFAVMDINGGTFTGNGGIQVGGNYAQAAADLVIRGTGVLNTSGITLGDSTGVQTTNTNIVQFLGGTSYVGSNGIAIATPAAETGAVTNTVDVGSTAYTTAPTIGALASWSSSVPMTLTNTTAGLAPTFQTADSSNNAATISLSGQLTGSGGLNVTGGGSLVLSGANNYSGLTTVQKGVLQLDTNAQSPVLSGAGANIEGGKVVFDYNGGSDPISTIQTDLTNSYNAGGGHFASGQLYSSTAVPGKYGLGYIDNTTTDQVTVMYTLYGDANLDGTVDAADFVLLSNNFGKSGTDWNQGNFNYDNTTDAADFVLLSNNFGQSVNGAAVDYLDASELATFNQDAANFGFSAAQISVWDAKVSGVPEPTSLLLAAIGGAGLLRRRVRRSK